MKKKTIIKMIKNLIFFISLILITFWILFRDQNIEELIDVIQSANIYYILLSLSLMFLFYFIEAYNIKKVLKYFGENITLLSALKFTLIGFFFSAITPAASGGQPAEIYYMTKEKISGAKATMTLLIQLCGFQISTISLGIICAIINPSILKGGIIYLFIIGVIINLFALTIMLICIFSKRLSKKLVNLSIKILKIFRFKNLTEKKEQFEKALEKYHESSNFIKSHKIEFIKAILRVFLQISIYYLVPFCIYKSFGLKTYNIFQIFTMQAVLYTTVSGLPLPGAIGVSEAVFLNIFGHAFGNEILNGAMLLNRGVTFYWYVIVSLFIVIINAIKMKSIKGEMDLNI